MLVIRGKASSCLLPASPAHQFACCNLQLACCCLWPAAIQPASQPGTIKCRATEHRQRPTDWDTCGQDGYLHGWPGAVHRQPQAKWVTSQVWQRKQLYSSNTITRIAANKVQGGPLVLFMPGSCFSEGRSFDVPSNNKPAFECE